MEVTPVRRGSAPGYPTRAIVDAHPELLRLVPKRWRNNPAVLTALAAVCVLLASGRDAGAKGLATGASLVAPVFVHGSGRGALGCVAVNPPVFLSEAEARQVIEEEAKKAGISFVADGGSVAGIRAPVTDRYAGFVDLHPTRSGRTPDQAQKTYRTLALDGVDKQRRIAYEVVSSKDFEAWERKDYRMGSTAYLYDLHGAALVLRQGLAEKKPRGAYAVFYDPAVGWEDARKGAGAAAADRSPGKWQEYQAKLETQAKSMSADELRAQVRDFIAWLKAQGVI